MVPAAAIASKPDVGSLKEGAPRSSALETSGAMGVAKDPWAMRATSDAEIDGALSRAAHMSAR
jgi:hypothetical protein